MLSTQNVSSQNKIIKNNNDSSINYHKYYIERQQKNIGKQYSTFNAESLLGVKYTNENLYGKVTLLNFWFEYCEPCIAEFPNLNDLFLKYCNNKFQLLSFTKDDSDETKLTVNKHNLVFPVICVSEKECYRLNFQSGFPTIIIINPKGQIIYIKSGGELDFNKRKNYFTELTRIIENQLDTINCNKTKY